MITKSGKGGRYLILIKIRLFRKRRCVLF